MSVIFDIPPNPHSPMRITTGSFHSNPPKPTSQTYPPSVPLYVYRELSAELQTTQAKLDALTDKNQQLVQENQLLRYEINKVVQSCLHLQKLVGFDAKPGDYQGQHSHPDVKNSINYPTEAHPRQSAPRSRQPIVPEASSGKNRRSKFSVPVMEVSPPNPETVFIEEPEVRYYPPKKPEAKELSGWWLALTILLIMLTAFGTGYLIVRPLLENQSHSVIPNSN